MGGGQAIRGNVYRNGFTPDNPYIDPGPYTVNRNAVSFDEQETNSFTGQVTHNGAALISKLTLNYSTLSGQQYYDSDYTPRGEDIYGGFGREDDHETTSLELQFTSDWDGPLNWVGGAYWFDQEAEWRWLSSRDTSGITAPVAFDSQGAQTAAEYSAELAEIWDIPDQGTDVAEALRLAQVAYDATAEEREHDQIYVPSWGNPNGAPHTVESLAFYGQATYEISDIMRVIGGLRYNEDEKTFTSGGDWEDDALLYKAALEYDVTPDIMAYGSIATGYRTGGMNDGRVVARGAPEAYGNEEVTSFEVGFKSLLMEDTVVLNVSAYSNEYEDVKAQLFALTCRDTSRTDLDVCVTEPSEGDTGTTTFEYYQNGGDSSTSGLEIELQYQPNANLRIGGNLTLTDAEFDEGFIVGSALINPYAGLGDYQGRQVTDENGNVIGFDMGGWKPAFTPDWSLGFNIAYDINIWGGVLTPYLQTSILDDYYTFDVNIPETLQESHTKTDIRVTWRNEAGVSLSAFVLNVEDEAVLNRTVVHSQRFGNLPVNSVQANYANPRTFGITLGYEF